MSEPSDAHPQAQRAERLVRVAARTELDVMAAVEAVAGAGAGWPLGVVVVELRRELDRRAVQGRSVRGGAVTEIAREIVLRGCVGHEEEDDDRGCERGADRWSSRERGSELGSGPPARTPDS